MEKKIYGVATAGDGEFNSTSHDGKIYSCWYNMLTRCYSNSANMPTYKECTVCEEWLNYQNFAKWYVENYYTIEGEDIQLDKDILVKGNKVYSPETCIFVPQTINLIFATKNNEKIAGVYKQDNRYIVRASDGEKLVHIGSFKNNVEAFCIYKEFKEKYVKVVAGKYKGKIPEVLYTALMDYKVNINCKKMGSQEFLEFTDSLEVFLAGLVEKVNKMENDIKLMKKIFNYKGDKENV